MSAGWTRIDAAWWEAIAVALPKPWPIEAALLDVRHHHYAGEDRGRKFFQDRWGWKKGRVTALLAGDDWVDPYFVPPTGHASGTDKAEISDKPASNRSPAGTRRAATGHPYLHDPRSTIGQTSAFGVAPQVADGEALAVSRLLRVMKEHHETEGTLLPWKLIRNCQVKLENALQLYSEQLLQQHWEDLLDNNEWVKADPSRQTWVAVLGGQLGEKLKERQLEEAPTVVDHDARWAAHEALLAEAKAKMAARAEREAARKAAK